MVVFLPIDIDFANFWAAFSHEYVSILGNIIVYGNPLKFTIVTLWFFEKLCSTSVMHFAPYLENQATDCFDFFTAAQLNIDVLISSLISIFLKCAGFFAQWVSNIYGICSSVALHTLGMMNLTTLVVEKTKYDYRFCIKYLADWLLQHLTKQYPSVLVC